LWFSFIEELFSEKEIKRTKDTAVSSREKGRREIQRRDVEVAKVAEKGKGAKEP